MTDEARNPPRYAVWLINALVIGAALSIPALAFAAWWFQNANLLLWVVVPFIFFMAG